jgi:hypothetical protein
MMKNSHVRNKINDEGGLTTAGPSRLAPTRQPSSIDTLNYPACGIGRWGAIESVMIRSET